MDKKHYSFPSIDQYRVIAKTVKLNAEYCGKDEQGEPIYDETLPKPTVTFNGTIKLHGTNMSIIFLEDGSVQYQSRETILSHHEDIHGFYNNFKPLEKELQLMMSLSPYHPFKEYMGVYGEWCGKGINKGTGIHQLPKMFVVFGVKIDDVWYNPEDFPVDHQIGIYNIYEFDTFIETIDFNDPASALDELNRVTLEVENDCPVARKFGIQGIGEGIVWVGDHIDEDGCHFIYRFKTKGEKHSLKSKEPKAVTLDIDKYNSVVEFVQDNLSPNRLEQGLSWLKENGLPIEITSIGQYLKWCVNDLKKECILEMEANNIDERMLNKETSKVAREYYINYLNTNL